MEGEFYPSHRRLTTDGEAQRMRLIAAGLLTPGGRIPRTRIELLHDPRTVAPPTTLADVAVDDDERKHGRKPRRDARRPQREAA